MGLGHVPAGAVRLVRAGGDVQGRQRRRAPGEGAVTIPGGAGVPRPGGREPGARTARLGRSGESAAAAWYEAAGYTVVARNWRCSEGELDLVVRRAHTVVFCEVKARSSMRFGTPAEAVTPTKQRRIRRLAARWLASQGATSRMWRGPARLRFDVVAILGDDMQVIEGAF